MGQPNITCFPSLTPTRLDGSREPEMSGGYLSTLFFHGATVEPTRDRRKKRSALHAQHLKLGLQGISEKCGQRGTGEELG